jgi:hypothetical protein
VLKRSLAACGFFFIVGTLQAAALETTVSSMTVVFSSSSNVQNQAFEPGESYSFVVSWGIVSGGYSSLRIPNIENIEGRPTYHIISEAHSGGVLNTFYHVEDLNEAWLDCQSLLTLRYEKHIHEGKYRIEETGTLDQIHHHYAIHAYRLDKNTYEHKEGELVPNSMDVLGSLYYVRTLPLAVGQSYSIDVFSGGKTWPLTIQIKKREMVKVPAGKFDCFLVEPFLREPGIFVTKGKKLEVWMTADEHHMPVRMRSVVLIGHVSAELVTYQHNTLPN